MDINNLIRPNIAQMQAYASARDEFKNHSQEMVYLDANENPFATPINRYPDAHQKELKTQIAYLKNCNTDQILLGNGSDEVLDLLFRAFCEPNIDNIITLPPTYGMYGVLANINSVQNKEVLLTESFGINVTKVLDTINKNTKILFLCSPNNPTGNSFLQTDILKLITNFNGIVVLDEAYIDFSEQESWLQKINTYPNLVVTQTLSKAYGMAGIRLGIAFANPAIIAVLNKIKPPYNINSLTQTEAIKNLKNTALITNQINTIIAQKEMLYQELQKINWIHKVYPSDANFILIKVDNANLRYQELVAHKIVIRNRSTQALCNNTLRITIGTPTENQQLITVLKTI